MLSGKKLKKLSKERKVSADVLAKHLVKGGRNYKEAFSAVKNWMHDLYKPMPVKADVESLARVLGVEPNDISEWKSSYRYAPSSPRKARLVTQLIYGRNVQDAIDILKFTPKRAAGMVKKVLENAVANADEQEANVENLVVCEARVDGAGRRIGTKGWIAKDRGRAHPIRKEASHIHVTVIER